MSHCLNSLKGVSTGHNIRDDFRVYQGGYQEFRLAHIRTFFKAFQGPTQLECSRLRVTQLDSALQHQTEARQVEGLGVQL